MVGEKIKKLMYERGLSPEELASILKVSRGTLYNWFKKDSVETAYLLAISNSLSVPVSYFFDEYNKPVQEIDGKPSSSKIENELRTQIDMLKQNNAFLQEMLRNALDMRDLALGKELGTSARRLCLVPMAGDEQQDEEANIGFRLSA
jgi:transcriptional regulator with XRE-family HTH domain